MDLRHPARREQPLFEGSRRLTGPNLLSRRPGAVLDVRIAGRGRGATDAASAAEAEAEAAIGSWRRLARRMLDALGWRTEELVVRRFEGGASLYLSAPLDALYTATEVNDWAWETSVGQLGTADEPDPAAFAAAAEGLRGAAASERNPALLALRAEAAARDVAFLADDEQVSVGLGAGSRTWPRAELPPPSAVNWAAVHDVPVALVTGTNGKTTTVRLAAAMLAAGGHVAGVTSTDLIAVGGTVLAAGDYSGPGGARTVLRDRRVEAAVLETARGGMLRRGLALERVTAAAVTNVAADHLGEYGVEDLAALAEVKLLVTRIVAPDGRAVLNADDPELSARGGQVGAPITWTSLRPRRPAVSGVDLAAHLAAGGDAVLLDGDRLVLARGAARREVVADVGAVPIAFGGAARFNLANALAAIGVAAALGVPTAAMAAGLAAVRNDEGAGNPGRGCLLEIEGFRVLLDYAHNPHGLAALAGFAATLPARRRLLLLGHAGDRSDQAIRDLAGTAWDLHPDRVILKEMPEMLRGRRPGEVPAIFESELLRLGASREQLGHAASEIEAVRQALDWARPGDLLVLLVHNQRDEAMALLAQRRRARDRELPL